MREYVPRDSAKVVIGVCGDQGSGKTVFLTCIFKSVMTAFPDDVIVSFDRENVGNANYFQSIEDSLIAKGPAEGTIVQTLYPARIFVKPYATNGAAERGMLTVDLLDFAGRHFRGIADVKDLPTESESDPEDVKALRQVKETLGQADAFVILINSTEIDPLDEVPKRNPFTASVDFMLSHCQEHRKPVALLFTQIDQTPRLTEELFRTFPRVKTFERIFTRDPEAYWRGERPFGVVQRISCFETIPGDLAPRRQTMDGSIWRREPAEIVLELLRSAMPQINERLKQEEEDLKKKQSEEEAKARWEALEKERKERAEHRRRLMMRVGALLGILLILGLLAFAWYKRTESGQVRVLDGVASHLRDGSLTAISGADQTALSAILAADRNNSGASSAGVRSAIAGLESALEDAAKKLSAEPALDAEYNTKIARFRDLVPLFDPSATESWRETLLPAISVRGDFLSDWFGTPRKERRLRTTFLDESAKRFAAAGDTAFQVLLAAQSTLEKETEIGEWQQRIDADADLTNRLATIQNLLALATAEQDLEYARLARKALAGHLARSILERHENGLLHEKLLTPLAAGLAKLANGEIRFEVLAGEVLGCPDIEECETRQGVVQATMETAQANVESWSAAVENLLRSLLSDRSLNERREVWGAIGSALASSYLFSAHPDAWPDGVEALPTRLAAMSSGEGDASEALIERIARHPIYEGELRYLGDRLAATVLRRRLVPVYGTMQEELEGGGTLSTTDLAQVERQVASALEGRTDATVSLVAIGSEIKQVLELARTVGAQRLRGGLGDPSVPERLKRYLRDAKSQHCAALADTGPPPEC